MIKTPKDIIIILLIGLAICILYSCKKTEINPIIIKDDDKGLVQVEIVTQDSVIIQSDISIVHY